MRPVVAALRKAASGQSSQAGAFVVKVTPTVGAKCGSPYADALSQPQIKTHAAKTQRIDTGSSTATARFAWRRDANIEASMNDGRQF